MNQLPPIEGFFLETTEGLIFDVKELSHPRDKVIAFVRYVPQEFLEGNFTNTRKGYVKLYDLNERYLFLQNNFPEYLFHDPKGRGLLQAVPKKRIKKIFDPRIKLQDIISKEEKSNLEETITNLIGQLIENSTLKLESFGISGSVLVDLVSETSDIDLVVYGKENGWKLYSILENLFQKSVNIRHYNKEELLLLMKNRDQETQLRFDDFYRIEYHKKLQGKINDVDFYIRLVPFPEEWSENYQSTIIKQIGDINVKAQIINDENSIFTPAIYYLSDIVIETKNFQENIMPKRIYSVRGRYCEIAKKGDKVRIKGKLELVKFEKEEFYQIVLGARKDEYFILL